MPENKIITITADFVERLANAVLDGTSAGSTASAFLLEKKDTLVGIGLDAFRNFIASLGGGTKTELYKARLALINSMSWDDVIALQESSAAAAEKHASEKVRLGAWLNAVGNIAENIIPKVATVLIGLI